MKTAGPDAKRPRHRAVVIDDEPIARAGLRAMLTTHPLIDVVGEAADGVSAVEVIQRLDPDIVFLDIRMPRRDGFRVVEALEERRDRVIVFVTAHADFALRAFNVGAVDYLLKPFNPERLFKTIDRAIRVLAGATPAPRSDPAAPDTLRLLVRKGADMCFVHLDQVRRIDVDRNYMRMATDDGEYLLRGTLRALRPRLDAAGFVRVSRSTAVNLRHVRRAHPLAGGRYDLELSDGEQLSSSRRCAREVRAALRTLGSIAAGA